MKCDDKKRYIFFYGSVHGAARKEGNIEVIDNIPHIIKENGMKETTDWNTVIQLAKNVSLSTYTWIKNINVDNWEKYAFTFHPLNQMPEGKVIYVYVFKDHRYDYNYEESAVNSLVIDRNSNKPYIDHDVANFWCGGHDPAFVSVRIECTFEDIRLLAKDLHIDSLLDIDENNWMDKIEPCLKWNCDKNLKK